MYSQVLNMVRVNTACDDHVDISGPTSLGRLVGALSFNQLVYFIHGECS